MKETGPPRGRHGRNRAGQLNPNLGPSSFSPILPGLQGHFIPPSSGKPLTASGLPDLSFSELWLSLSSGWSNQVFGPRFCLVAFNLSLKDGWHLLRQRSRKGAPCRGRNMRTGSNREQTVQGGQARLSICLQALGLWAGREQVTAGMGGTRKPQRMLEQAGALNLGRFLCPTLNNDNSSN